MNEQHEIYEKARIRVKQKQRFYVHFVILLVGAAFLFVLNKVLKVGETFIEDWFIWAIILWLFFWVLHFVNVFVTNKFMGKDWERKQTEKLVLKQEQKIEKLAKKVEQGEKIKDENIVISDEPEQTEISKKNSTKE